MLARYKVGFSPAAGRQLQKLPAAVRERIIRAAERLEENPRPVGARKLASPEQMYRLRVGDYRLLYEIEDDKLLVLVVRVAHRKDAYRGM